MCPEHNIIGKRKIATLNNTKQHHTSQSQFGQTETQCPNMKGKPPFP